MPWVVGPPAAAPPAAGPKGDNAVNRLLWIAVVVLLIFGAMYLVTKPMSDAAVAGARERTSQQQLAESGQTDRARIAADTEQQAARLRAEQAQRTADSVTVIVLVIAGGAVLSVLLIGGIYLLDWSSSRRLERTLLLLEARRAGLALPEPAQEIAVLPIPSRPLGITITGRDPA